MAVCTKRLVLVALSASLVLPIKRLSTWKKCDLDKKRAMTTHDLKKVHHAATYLDLSTHDEAHLSCADLRSDDDLTESKRGGFQKGENHSHKTGDLRLPNEQRVSVVYCAHRSQRTWVQTQGITFHGEKGWPGNLRQDDGSNGCSPGLP